VLPVPAAPTALRCWLGFAGFYAASFAVLGAYMQFFPAWLHQSGGLSKENVSLVMAGQTVARTVAGPWWSQRVDRVRDARAVMRWLSWASIGAFALYGPQQVWWWSLLAALVFGSIYSPLYPIVDAAAMQTAGARGFAFGRLRMVGSASYLVVILVAGFAFEAHGTDTVFPVLLLGMVLMAVSSLALPPVVVPPPPSAAPQAPWWSLLRSRQFVLLLAASAAIQGSHATYYNLSTVHWNDHGIGKGTAGLLWAEGILAEILMFFVARQTIERLRPTTLLMLGGLGAAVRWTVVGASTSVPVLAAVGWLHAFSFTATYLGTLRALEKRVPPHQRATAQGLLGAATSGIGMVVCGLLGGWLYARIEGGAFAAMAGFALLGTALAFWLRRLADRNQGAPSEQ
jgi:PPP family 3-phenylpropionic acid transporter